MVVIVDLVLVNTLAQAYGKQERSLFRDEIKNKTIMALSPQVSPILIYFEH